MKLSLPKEQLKTYQYIRSGSRKNIITGQFPDFLIIGPQRTGTTWIAANLNQHPEIFLSSPKELYFFSRLPREANTHSKHYVEFNWEGLKSRPKALLLEIVKIAYFDYYKTGFYQANEIEWYLSFFRDSWIVSLIKHLKMFYLYREFFRPKVKGEATASYSIMNKTLVQEMISLNPNIKVVIMVRDPVKRAWSHAKKDLSRNVNRPLNQIPEDEFHSFFGKQSQIDSGSYLRNIEKWSSLLKENHLFVGFYEDIKVRPKEFLLELFEFLGVDKNPKYVGIKAEKIFNNTKKDTMPSKYVEVLEQIYANEKSELMKTYNRNRL